MSSDNGGSGVPIPENALTIIREIRANTGKQHTDEDVYAMLKQCAMDPSDTAQKLLYLDTFQVFKSKREKKRENLNSKVPDSQWMPYNQGRWARGNRNFSSKKDFYGGVRNLPSQREKRSNGFPERASGPAPSHQKSKDTSASNGIILSTVAANGPSHLSNGVSESAKTPIVEDVVPAVASGNSMNKKNVPNKSDKVEKTDALQSLTPPIVKETANNDSGLEKEASVPIEVVTSGVASVSVEASSQSSPTLVVCDSQNVTFPNHFTVSAFTNGFIFGSFGSISSDNVEPTAQPSQESDGRIKQSSPSSNQARAVADHSQPLSIVHDETPSPCENNFTHDVQKLNTLLPPPEDSQSHVVQDGPHTGYTFGFLPYMSSSQTLQTEGPKLQSQDLSRPSYLVNNTVPAYSSSSPTSTAQSSSPLSPQKIPVYRQPYPLGYIPYGHYLAPFYMPQMHQLLGHNAFAQQQPSAGNMFVPPTMASAQQGLKLPYPMYKPENNPPVGIPSGYSAYGPMSVAYSSSPAAVTTETSVNSDDLAASHLKENHVYSYAQLSEAPAAMWIPQPGQDLNSLQQLNSVYTLPQGQQITVHGAFGVQPPQQTMSGVSTAHTIMQQSQAGAVETVGLPSGSGGTSQLPLMN